MNIAYRLRFTAERYGLEAPKTATLMMEAANTIEFLDTENSELREFCEDIYKRFRGVVLDGWSYSTDDLRMYEQRMRELGMEVE